MGAPKGPPSLSPSQLGCLPPPGRGLGGDRAGAGHSLACRAGSRSGQPRGQPQSAAAGHHPVAKKEGSTRKWFFCPPPPYLHPEPVRCPQTPQTCMQEPVLVASPVPAVASRSVGGSGQPVWTPPWLDGGCTGWRVNKGTLVCLLGTKWGEGGGQPHSPRCLNAASLPVAPDICSRQECRERNQGTPWGQGHPTGRESSPQCNWGLYQSWQPGPPAFPGPLTTRARMPWDSQGLWHMDLWRDPPRTPPHPGGGPQKSSPPQC